MSNIPSADLLSRDDAAAFLGISPSTLAKWACQKTVLLPYVKVGRLVRYRKSDLMEFIARSRVDHVSVS